MRLLLGSLLLLLAAVSETFAGECAKRSVAHGIVCVCNATYCDTFPPLTKTAPGTVVSYRSSADGDRFHRTEGAVHFQKTAPQQIAAAATITIDHAKKFQKIIGFGGAFTDAAGLNIAKLDKALQDRLIRDYFAADGIEYTLGRVPIAGCDFSTRPYTYHEVKDDDNLTHFALVHEDHDYKLPYLKLAAQVTPHKLLTYGSAWSAPAWIKTNHELNHGGYVIGKPGERYYKVFARYFRKFIQAYEAAGVPIWGLTIINEPLVGFEKNFPWNSVAFSKEVERDFIKHDLGPELAAHNFGKDRVKIMVFDHNIPEVKDYASTILVDQEAAKYVSGIAFHWYGGPKSDWGALDYLHQHFPDKFLLATEACKEGGVSLGDWNTFNRYAVDILKDLNHFSTGWTDWNLVLDMQGGPNWVHNYVDAPILVNSTHEYLKQPHYYAMGHFSKLLVPNSQRVHQDLATSDHNIASTVFVRPDNATVVTVLNQNTHSVVVRVHDPAHGYLDLSLKPSSMESLVYH